MKRIFPYIICMMLLWCIPIETAAQETVFSDKITGGSEGGMVGAIEAEYDVSPSGQFHYEIPVPSVAGTGGMKPNVSLVYDSSSKDGLLGYGFDLAGISLIHRVPSNVINDGIASAVNFSSTDNFALDGVRLNFCYARSVSQCEYRTEQASYSRIISTGDRLNPSSFTVETKSGLKYEYQSLGAIAGVSSDSTLFWPMTKVMDSKGNYYTVSYTIDPEFNSFQVSSIDYTGNDAMGLSPYARLEFSYIPNANAPTSFIYGKKVNQSRLLSSIKVYSDDKCVRRFDIQYSVANGRYFVKKIKEFGIDGAYLNPTTFEWYRPESFSMTNVNYSTNQAVRKAILTVGDFNGDGKSDFLATPEDKNSGWKGWKLFISKGKLFNNQVEGAFRWPDDEIKQVVSGDFNGDGLCDILNMDVKDCCLLQSNGRGNMTEVSTLLFLNSQHHIYPGDFNGDGKTDLLVTGWDGDPNKDGWKSWIVMSSKGNGNFEYNYNPRTFKDEDQEIIVSDINGDGYDDVQGVPRSSGNSTVRPSVYLNNGDGIFYYHAQGGNIYGLDKWRFYTGDFNGDGKVDMLCTSDWSNSNRNGFQLYLMPENPTNLLHSIKDGLGNTVSVDYKYMSDESVGRLVSETDAAGNTTSMAYDGLMTTSTDALGCSTTRKLSKSGNLWSTVDNDGTEIRYSYDVEGKCTKAVCGDRKIEISYDIHGNRTRLDDPDLGVSTSEYNSFGELIKKTDPYGTTVFTYDAGGRVIKESHDDATIETTYDTEWKGSVSEVTVQDHSLGGKGYTGIRYRYDGYGRLTSQTTSINRTSFTSSISYNERNLVDVLTYPTGVSVRNSYDESGMVKSVTDCSSGVVYWQLLSLDARGQVEKEKYGNGVVTSTTHDSQRGLISGISASGIQNWSYAFDAVGNLISRKDMARNLKEDFLYDSLHRLSTVKKNGVTTQRIEYDAYGNITFKSDVGDYGYEEGSNRLAYIDASACEPKIWDEIRYNSRGKVSFIKSGSASMTLQYGPDGSCVQKVEGDIVRYYIGRLFETYVDGRTVTDRNLIYGGGKPVAIVVGNPQAKTLTVQYVHLDHLGSIQALSDSDGNLIEEFSYDAWGMRRNPEDWSVISENHGFGEIHGFSGNEHLDLFCIVDMRGRLYDPLIGRFISPDPIVQLAEFSQGLNRYAYCLNNPLSLVDPSGYSWFSKNWKSIVASIVGIGVGALTLGTGTGLGIAIIAGAAGGAAGALTGALLNGSNFGQIAKSTLIGGIIGAAGGFLNFASADPNIFLSIAKHSFSQGWLDGIQGGNAVHGFMMGAVSKLGGSAVDALNPHMGLVGGLMMNSILSGVVDELGGGKFANGAVTGSFSYLFNETLHRVQDRGDSDDSGSMLADAIPLAVGFSEVDGPLPYGDIIGGCILLSAATYDAVQYYKNKVYLTYTLINDYGMIYIGRTSGFGDPHTIMMK